MGTMYAINHLAAIHFKEHISDTCIYICKYESVLYSIVEVIATLCDKYVTTFFFLQADTLLFE